MLADEDGLPLQFRITAGQAGEYAPAADLLQARQADAVIADRGYDADCLVAQSESLGATAVIPPKRNRKHQRAYNRELYKQRNRIKRCFNKLKHFRRFATRYCKTIEAFRSFTALACAWLRLSYMWIHPSPQTSTLSGIGCGSHAPGQVMAPVLWCSGAESPSLCSGSGGCLREVFARGSIYICDPHLN